AVVRFGAVSRPPETEKAVSIGVGAQAHVLHLTDIGAPEPSRDIAGKIEQRMAFARGGPEEAITRRILGAEAGDEIGADLIVALADHRAEPGADLAALGAKPLHGIDRRFDDPGERAAPAGMRRSDDAGLRVGKEDRPAIGRGYADGERACPRDDSVGT